jgi:hypothetical protein
MSNENREVMYGSDKPCGGFYITEFLRDDEVKKTPEQIENKEVVDYEEKFMKQGLTLTDLNKILANDYSFTIDSRMMIQDWISASDPTPLQHSINKLFGKNLTEMLVNVEKDLFYNWSY